MRKINLIPLFIACILSACLSPSEGDGSPDELPTVTPTSSPTTVFTATPSQTLTPEPSPTPTPDPAQIAAEEMAKLNLTLGVDYTLAPDANGNLAAFNADGVKIYEPNTHRWNSEEIAKIVENSLKITGDCYKTSFTTEDTSDPNWRNFKSNVNSGAWDLGLPAKKGTRFINVRFESVNGNCWGTFNVSPGEEMNKPNYFFWPTKEFSAENPRQIRLLRLFNP
ncbi:MAG: hypothetical protein HS100_08390 [Anaerolineales bacterium]|nr:hypothetical protein [Anaerolineales bacterium]